MLLKKQEKRYRDYLKCNNRYWEIREQIRKMPAVKLDKPYQKGWVIYLDLRDDIKNRKDYSAIRKCFDLVARESKTRDVKVIKRLRGTKRYNKAYPLFKDNWLGNIVPSFGTIDEKRYSSLAPDEKKFFEIDPEHAKWVSFRGNRYWLNIPHFWIEVKVKPNMITHHYQVNPALEKEMAELDKKLDMYRLEFGINYSKSYPAYKDRTKIRDKIQKYKKGEIEDIPIEKVPLEYVY